MHPHTHPSVSEFHLHPPSHGLPSQQPPNATLRHSQLSHHSQTATDVRINVLPHPQQPSPSLKESNVGNIRADIDACLSAVEVAMERRNKGQQNFIGRSGPEEGAILRIDSNIVMDYVSTVYRDYPIRNRYGHYRPQTTMGKSHAMQNTLLHHPQQANASSRPIIIQQQPVGRHERTSSSRPSKQFLNITQQSKMGRKDVSFSSQKREGIVTVHPQRNTFSVHNSPVILQNTLRAPQSSIKRSQVMGRMRQDFRYCINCERAVLWLNADFHEQYECPNFHQLEKMGFRVLGELVVGKAQRMRNELKGLLVALREESGRGGNRGQAITNQLVDLMQEYVSEEGMEVNSLKDQMREERRRLKYSLFRESTNNLHAQAVELTHKLHWFQEISTRLRQEQEKTHETTSNKAEQGRALQCIRSFAPPSSPIHSSPVTYMHPHLHRLPRHS